MKSESYIMNAIFNFIFSPKIQSTEEHTSKIYNGA